jgi:hypothetical protein
VSVVRRQVVAATSRSLVRRGPAECRDREASIMRFWPTRAVEQ